MDSPENCEVSKGDYVIIGFPKCGTVSLQKYLKKKHGVKVHRNEILWSEKSLGEWNKHYQGCKPVIIKRDPIERIWSAYNYYAWAMCKPFYIWIENDKPLNRTGTNSPIQAVNYDRFIQPFLHLKPEIYQLEEITDPEFTNENKNIIKKPMPPENRQLVEQMMRSGY